MIIKFLMNYLITQIKDQEFIIDKNISDRYLLFLLLNKTKMLFKGLLKFHKLFIFIGKKTVILEKNKISIAGPIQISNYCYIDALSIEGIKFGRNVSIGQNTTIQCTGTLSCIGKGIIVGDNVGLGTHGFFGCAGGVRIGDETIFGNFVSIHSENHNYGNLEIPIRLQGVNHKGVVIGRNCWIGAKSTILDGTTLGDGCIVAAGAVVSGCFPSNVIIGGVPAKVIKMR